MASASPYAPSPYPSPARGEGTSRQQAGSITPVRIDMAGRATLNYRLLTTGNSLLNPHPFAQIFRSRHDQGLSAL